MCRIHRLRAAPTPMVRSFRHCPICFWTAKMQVIVTNSKQKIVQSHSSAVFTVNEHEQLVLFLVPMLMPWRVVESTTRRIMMEQQRRLSCATPANRSFALDFRVVCTDSGSDNFCDVGLSAQRFGDDGLVRTRCMIHKTSTQHEKSF